MERRIFRKGSTSFFAASWLFPKDVRRDVTDLYSFVRIADDYVDKKPDQPEKLQELANLWGMAKNNPRSNIDPKKSDSTNIRVVKNIARLSRKYEFDKKWVDNFLSTMEADLKFKPKKNLDDSLKYCQGSAEVVGLMMSRLMGLPEKLDNHARLLGRAFQWANFIRDIDEDDQLGRCYFPANELKNFGLPDLNYDTAFDHRTQLKDFIVFQIQKYEKWRDEAKQAFPLIPRKQRVPLEVAIDLFDWTLARIEKNPMVIYDKKVRPPKALIIIFMLKRII